ncbi:tetratricopeptide repeat protein [bacterium]|nr:tetratricopeptide repeat protein [bacterium]
MKKPKLIPILLLILTLSACAQPLVEQPAGEVTGELQAPTENIPTPAPTPTATPTPVQLADAGDQEIFAGDYELALENYQTALSSNDPTVVDKANFGIGQAYYSLGSYAAALDSLRLAAASADSVIAARANYLMGRTFVALERYDEAQNAYDAFLALRPGLIDSHVYELKGDLYNLTGAYPQAITNFQEAYRSDPYGGNDALAVKIAVAYQNSGDVDTALSLYQDLYNTTDNDYTKAQMDLLIGRIYYDRGDTEQAYGYYQDAVNAFPFAYDSYSALVTLVNDNVPVNEYQRGLINYNVGNYALAVEAFDRFLATEPEAYADAALYFKALAVRAAGSINGEDSNEAAILVWQELINTYPVSDYFIDAWEDIEYTLWAYMDEPLRAAEAALDFVARYPDDPNAGDFLFLAGRSYERTGNLALASETWQRIANEYPNSAEIFRSVYFAGIVTVRMGDWAAAEPLFARALLLTSEPSEQAAAYLWIGKCQDAQGDISAALDTWKVAQTTDPFGYYSIRAEDLLLDQGVFTPADSVQLDTDLTPYRLAAENWLRETFELSAETNLESPGLLANDPRFQRGLEYCSLGLYEIGKAEFEALRLDLDGDPAQTFRLIPALVDIGLYRSALVATNSLLSSAGMENASALEAPEFFSRIRFGAYYLDWVLPAAEFRDIDPLLILALIRQESHFEGFAESSAAARGLMQIIPSTGAQLATDLGWPDNYTADDLYRPYVSIVYGTTYLARQRQFFEGDLYNVLAAYNGGPGNTIAWNELAPDDPDLFLESVRIEETRTYIKLITENYYIYKWLYGETVLP